MARPVNRWEASDGSLHMTKEEAEHQEDHLELVHILSTRVLGNVDAEELITFISRHKELIKKFVDFS